MLPGLRQTALPKAPAWPLLLLGQSPAQASLLLLLLDLLPAAQLPAAAAEAYAVSAAA
jgi:hypothetical protein